MVCFQGCPLLSIPGAESECSLGLSSTQSPFACPRRYLSHRNVMRPVSGHYPAFIARTDSCVNPKSSLRLEFNLGRLVFAGCGQPLLEIGSSRRYLCESCPTCLDPYPGCSCGALTHFFPQDNGLPDVRTRSAQLLSQLWLYPYSNFSTGRSFEAAIIH